MNAPRPLKDLPGWGRALEAALVEYSEFDFPFALGGEIVVPLPPDVVTSGMVLFAGMLLDVTTRPNQRLRLVPATHVAANDCEASL